VDSEASLSGVEARLSDDADNISAMPSMSDRSDREMATHQTQATVEAINGRMLTLTHPAIPSLQWPGMTMDFKLASSLNLNPEELTVGAQIDIEFRIEEGSSPVIVNLQSLSSAMEIEGAK
jgi:Cu(I)/Ag(I) efflux system membrane fusion protein